MNNRIENKNKSGFSLGEALITLGIIGVVAAVTIPILYLTIPSKTESLHKKGDYMLEHTVSDLVNSEEYYPVLTTQSGPDGDIPLPTDQYKYGLRNTSAVIEDNITYAGETKFCKLMASKFNLYPGTTVKCTATAANPNSSEYSFKSIDGIEWKMPISDFSTNTAQNIIFKTSDEKGPNCFYGPTCPKPDKFLYHITPEGKLYKEFATSDKLNPKYD